ncbi:MAG: hypothetical protein ACRD0U_05450 [Acidimicrobiales bacterium]
MEATTREVRHVPLPQAELQPLRHAAFARTAVAIVEFLAPAAGDAAPVLR